MNETDLQRQYYERTSSKFDEMHLGKTGNNEHVLACDLIAAFLQGRDSNAKILDVGGGTGRFYRYLSDRWPNAKFDLIAIEPSEAQRRVAYENGVPEEKHIEGDATNIEFPDNTFDYATEFGVLHHIKNYRQAVREMCRVSAKGIFLSESNRYGQGSLPLRLAKAALWFTGTYGAMDSIRTMGKGYRFSEGDGVFYSFSAFDVLDIVRAKFPNLYAWPTRPVTSSNLFIGCNHVLIAAYR